MRKKIKLLITAGSLALVATSVPVVATITTNW